MTARVALDPAALILMAGLYRLRPTACADRGGIMAAARAPTIGGVMPWFPSPFPDSYADDWIARAASSWASGQHWVFSILDQGGVYAGGVVLSARKADARFEIAYWVLPDKTGKGVATEGAKAVLDWARDALQPAGVFAKAKLENHASRAVLRKLGFADAGAVEGSMTFMLDD